MNALKEHRKYQQNAKVWVGHYRNSHNTEHWHHDCELVFIEQGSLNITVDGVPYNIEAGYAAFIASKQQHRMEAVVPDTIATVIFFDCELINDFFDHKKLSSPVLSRDYNISSIADDIEHCLKDWLPYYEIETICKIRLLMIDIFRNEQMEAVKKIKSPPPARCV